MNKPGILSVSTSREITNDWRESFPLLGIYKSMWLLKRHGPLLMGIALDRTRSNDVYLPTFHVHNLLVPAPAILLSLVYPVPDMRQVKLPRQIKVLRHADDYLSAVAFLKQAVPDLDASVLSWRRLVQLHSDFIRQKRDYAIAKSCSRLFLDVILLAYWCGHEDYARHCEAEAVRLMKDWNPSVDVAAWQTSLHGLLDRGVMQRTLDSEISRHKLAHLPVCELSGDGEAEAITVAYTSAWAS
ncbi:hypothetical protein [Paucibacter sp. XJ19-41]|uniref:hypothetical protein n=1 Tax=Paucibacter sp. XJ19-41 TaxID=2927824 RepID=UPI00234A0F8C|nr:hypothetical protein [Paucibacter sp. XJ19-41]MDC6167876.1 hypothetical protein [Paucibacter sp. XJ19-41]